MPLYLDINGVLLNQELTPAKGVVQFLKSALKNNEVYWLTTHCKGDTEPVIVYLERFLPSEAFELIKLIKPTNWDVLKTEAIDFTKDFLWFDDNIFESEMRVLKEHGCEKNFVHVDLKRDPSQLEVFVFN